MSVGNNCECKLTLLSSEPANPFSDAASYKKYILLYVQKLREDTNLYKNCYFHIDFRKIGEKILM